MTIITPEQKLADVILRNYHLIPVVNRFGIELGFGDKSISEVCREHAINEEFFAALLNTISYESYFSDKKLNVANMLQLVDYLKKTLINYKESQIGVIEIHIQQLINSSPEKNKHLQLIENFFFQFKEEFLSYEKDVNKEMFELASRMYTDYKEKNTMASGYELPDFETFQEKYEQLTEKLSDMKSLLIKYLSGNFDRRIRNAIIYIISRFEADFYTYIRLQNRLLQPMMKEVTKNNTGK
ncbi:MAG: hypothetical protein LUG18_15135 [Candidatus Azobacteroides sp.]|nr:hypothetical protein [Candidatus Azobacteroides sp.]